MIGGTNEPNSGITEGQRHVITAAHHLVKALRCTDVILSSETKALLSDLDVHLSSIKLDDDHQENHNIQIEGKLASAQQVIASSLTTVSEYLQAVEDVQTIATSLERSTNKSRKTNYLLDMARGIMQMAMDRLERELSDILSQNQLCSEEEQQGSSPISEEDESVVEEINASQRESSSTEQDDYVMDLIHPDMIRTIKSIADLMIGSGYDKEFFRVFIGFWRNVLTEHLTVLLDFEPLGVEDVLQIEWKSLNFTIKKWRRAIRSFVGVYLASVKRLFDQVLEDSLSSACLLEASKACLMSLLNFGGAILVRANRPEWLFCLLNMHEALSSVVPLVDSLFGGETISTVKIESHELLRGLEQSAKAIFMNLGNCISLSCSNTPLANGDVHPLTKYVMNYIISLADYEDILLEFLLLDDLHPISEANSISPLSIHLKSLTSTLEANLRERSNLYKDPALKHIFMINNTNYMVRKIEGSAAGIGRCFGDDWIRVYVGKIMHHAMRYERATWGSILDLIRTDANVTTATLKVRCRAFAAAFEDVYRTQTRWSVPNLQLREELRICASEALIPAYRSFVGKITDAIGEKHIKYKESDLEIYIFDLLEGNPKSLNHSSWKR